MNRPRFFILILFVFSFFFLHTLRAQKALESCTVLSTKEFLEGIIEKLETQLLHSKETKHFIGILEDNKPFFYGNSVDSISAQKLLSIAKLIAKRGKKSDNYWLLISLYAHDAYVNQQFDIATQWFHEILKSQNLETKKSIDLMLDAAKYVSFIDKIKGEREAYRTVKNAIALYRKYHKNKQLGVYLNDLGALLIQNEPLVVFEMSNYALDLFKLEPEETVVNELIKVHMTMGQTMLMAGRLVQSLNYYTTALQYVNKTPDVPIDTRISVYNSLARVYSFSRNIDSTRYYLKKLEKATNAHPNPSENQRTAVYALLSRYYSDKEMFDSAIYFRQKMIDIDQERYVENSLVMKSSYYALSLIYWQKGDLETSMEYAHKTLLLDYPVPFGENGTSDAPPLKMYPGVNVNTVLQSLMMKIFLQETQYAKTGDIKWLQDARKHYYVMDFMAKNLQESMLDKNFLALLKLNTEGYKTASITMKALYNNTGDSTYLNDLYFFSTALKGRYLAYQNYQLDMQKETVSEDRNEYLETYKQINELKARLDIVTDVLETKQINDSLLDLNIQISLMKQDQQQGVGTNTNNFNVDMYHAAATTLKNSIDSRTALIEYEVLDDSLQIFVFTENSLQLCTVKAGEEYLNSLDNYRKSVMTGGDISHSTIGNYLIDPIYSIIKEKSNLVIISDNQLFAIPFEGIPVNSTSQKLIDTFSVRYHYSGYFWYRSFTNTKNPPNPSIALFAPVFDQDKNALLATSNPYRNSEILQNDSVLRGNNNLQSLPFSRVEVEQIAEKFTSKNLEINLFVDEKANEQAFRKNGNADIIHIATHGVSNKDRPEQSGLFFSQSEAVVSSTDYMSDGFLHLNELYDLDFSADLAVLSACKSGVGEIFEGEGFFGLPRGFILAGANNLIVSLWKIHDEKTASLINRFYDHLLQGNDYANSLRLAKLDMIKKGYLPIDWSGIIFIGK
ncbi:MAG: CHAT domain-containing protein [Salinivirgaceae bacterium]|nr:CHAT domain-containing protein [Salinivirgaceae bacterium]